MTLLRGLYLVSVRRDDVLIRAVGPEFVLAQHDVLYFTGLVESLGQVCADYGLMAVTSEQDSDDEKEIDRGGAGQGRTWQKLLNMPFNTF